MKNGHLSLLLPASLMPFERFSPGPEWAEVNLGRVAVRRFGRDRFELMRVHATAAHDRKTVERWTVGAEQLPSALVTVTALDDDLLRSVAIAWPVPEGTDSRVAYARRVATMKQAVLVELRKRLGDGAPPPTVWFTAPGAGEWLYTLHVEHRGCGDQVAAALADMVRQLGWATAARVCAGSAASHHGAGIGAALAAIEVDEAVVAEVVGAFRFAAEPPF